MESNQQNAPVALTKRYPTGPEILTMGSYLVGYREKFNLTQHQAAKLLKVPYRRLQAYEATSGWSAKNRARILEYPGLFDFSATHELARQGWPSQRSLAKAIERIIAGETPRKRHRKAAGGRSSDSNLTAIEQRLREKYATKVVIDEGTITLHHYGNSQILEMLIEKLNEGGAGRGCK